jgi:hypothetical protein
MVVAQNQNRFVLFPSIGARVGAGAGQTAATQPANDPERRTVARVVPGGGRKMKVGDAVEWQWGRGTARGTISERFDRRVQRTIKRTKVVRNGSPETPAYLIEQDDGGRVLKLASELSQP